MQDSVHEAVAGDDRVARIREQFAKYAFVADLLDSVRKPYVEGLEHIPEDGRCLLVANHVMSGSDVPLIMYEVFQRNGKQVRSLVHRAFGQLSGFLQDLSQAMGVVVGSPENADALMAQNEPVLVFPGGGPETTRGRDELHQLLWGERKGFARAAVKHNYPIIPTTIVGADYEYRVLTRRNGLWSKVAGTINKVIGAEGMDVWPLMHGVAGTPIPYPQRMYLRFSPPVETAKPAWVSDDQAWVDSVREATKSAIETGFVDLLALRRRDPFRHLAPWARRRAVMPA